MTRLVTDRNVRFRSISIQQWVSQIIFHRSHFGCAFGESSFFCGAKLIFCCIRFHRFPKYFRCYIESTTQNVAGWIIKIYCWCKQFPCRIRSFFVLKLDHTLGVQCHCIQIANSLSHREKADSTRTLLKLHRWTALSFRKLI